MDLNPTDLLTLAQQGVTYAAPLIAGGALAKVGEDTTDQATALLGRLWGLCTRQFQGQRKAAAALSVFEDEPDDPKNQERLVQQIVACFQGQPAAIADLAELVRQFQAVSGASHTVQHRSITVRDQAQVGTAITGDVQGNLTIGALSFGPRAAVPPPAPPPSTPAAHATTLPATVSADGVHFSYGHALCIGVGQYAQWQLSAPTTATDAERLAAVLTDPAVAAYPPQQVTRLCNAAATRAGILSALDTLAAQLRQASHPTVLLFFAGHGIQQDDTYFLLPFDYHPQNLAGSAIDAPTFKAKIDALAAHAQKLLIMLNCCHAGGVGDGVLSDTSAAPATTSPPRDFYTPLAAGSGRVVISSSRAAERSGARSSHDPTLTVFGAQVLAALQHAPGHGPAIGVFDLFTALSRHVPGDAETITDPTTHAPLQQHPLIYTREVDQNVAVTLRPLTQRHDGPLDTTLTAAIQRLAAVEVMLASFASEADAPPDLVAERNQLLQRVGA